MTQQGKFDITIAGEVNLDLILYGLPEEMAVERELLASGFSCTLGSSSAIVAHNLSSLGMKVGFITKAGADHFGEIALERLRGAGVDISRSINAPEPLQTGVTILLHHGKTRHILTYPGAMATMSSQELDLEYLAASRHFHVSSIYLQTALQAGLPGLCAELKARGLTISLDTNDDPEDRWGEPLQQLLGLIDIFLPNEDEAKRIAKTDDVNKALTFLAARVPIVAIKCGSRGSIAAANGQSFTIPTSAVQPVDTIGAGDSFNSGFLQGYLTGLTIPQCAELGNATAALSTLRTGGIEAFCDRSFMKSFLAERVPTLLDHVETDRTQ
jgi:sugar/nucleoside kinase (ribokinase family)